MTGVGLREDYTAISACISVRERALTSGIVHT